MRPKVSVHLLLLTLHKELKPVCQIFAKLLLCVNLPHLRLGQSFFVCDAIVFVNQLVCLTKTLGLT